MAVLRRARLLARGALPDDGALLAVLAVGALLRVILAFVTPLLFAPDETGHALYVHEAAHGAFPTDSSDWLWGTSTGADEFFQPPLYYVLAGSLYRALLPFGTGALYGVRLLNVVIGLGVAVVTWHLCRAAFPNRRGVARWAASGVVLLPTFIGDSSSINNDVLCTLFVALGTLILARSLRRGTFSGRDAVMLAAALGAGLWTKSSSLVLVPAILASGGVLWWRHHTGSGLIRACSAIAGGVVLVLPWWIGRNLVSYGSLVAAGFVYPKWTVPLGDKLSESMQTYPQTFFAAFGRINEVRPLTTVSMVLGAIAAVLLLVAALRFRSLATGERDAALVLGVEGAAVIISALLFGLGAHQLQGRYLFYALPALAALTALGGEGIAQQIRVIPPRAGRLLAAAAVAYSTIAVTVAIGGFTDVQVVHRVGGPTWVSAYVTHDPATWVQSRVIPVTR